LLTDKGKDTFHSVTYEDFFTVLRKYYKGSKNIAWLDYLDKRYINMVVLKRNTKLKERFIE
jgi:hypothetical protein